MSRWMPVLALFLLVFGAAAARAQPRPGDWVVADTGQTSNAVLYFDPLEASPAPLTTLVPGHPPVYMNWLRMHPDNRSLLAAESFSGRLGVIQVPGGVFTSIVAVPDSPNGLALDQDGTLIVSTSGGDRLLRVDLAASTSTVIATLPSVLNHVAIDRDTGEILAAIFDMNSLAGGRVIRLSRAGQVLGTLASGFGMTTAVGWDPVTGDFFVTSYDAPEVQRVTRTGVATTVIRFGGANAVKVDEETGTLVVGGFDRTARMTAGGQILRGEDHKHPL
ncbi:MAG: hypothetical protein JXQ29_05270, partial [Planctomycetes bacterium]|nr:hypothetical protein [Planctomycetota bacterium]